MDFTIPVAHGIKIKASEKRTEKVVEHEGDGGTNCRWSPWNGPEKPEKKLGELKIRVRIETIHITKLLKSTAILRKVLKK